MRELSTHNDDEIIKTITNPFYLIDMGFNVNLRYCSLKTITIKGHTWTGDRTLKVSNIKTRTAGEKSGLIQLSDVDEYISTFVLDEGCAGKSIDIYQGYGTPSADSDIYRIFSGYMDDADINDTSVSIKLIDIGDTRMSPGIIVERRNFPYIPPAGKVISVAGAIVTLESRP